MITYLIMTHRSLQLPHLEPSTYFSSPSETAGLPECDTASEEQYEQSCYTYAHIYNNMMTGGNAFDNGAEFLGRYSITYVVENFYQL